MNNLASVTVYADGFRGVSFRDYQSDHKAEAEIIAREIGLIQKYLIDGQDVSTELRSIMIFGHSVTLEYTYPTWSRKIDADRLKSNLETNSSKIRKFVFTKRWMNVSFRLREDEQSVQEDYRQLLDYSMPCRSQTDAVLGFVERSNMQHMQYADLKRYSPMMIVGESGIGKTELVISMLDSMMKKSKPRDLQFAIIDRDINGIVNRLNLKDSGYLHKFEPVDIVDRQSVSETLSEVVKEIERRKMLLERFNKVVTYKGVIDQWCQIIVTIDRLDNFVYSRFEIIKMIRLIAEADPSLNVRLIMTSRNTHNSEFALYSSPKEFFNRTYELKVNSLAVLNDKRISSCPRKVAELFDRDGMKIKSFETVKISKK